MRRRWSLIRSRVRTLLVVVLLGPPGCGQNTGSIGGTIEIELVPGETAGGSLVSGQGLRATAFVEAGHIYQISARLSEATVGSTVPDGTEGVVSGVPLAEPVRFSIESSPGGAFDGSQSPDNFIPQLDGEVAIEFAYTSTDTTDSVGGVLGAVRALLFGTTRRATYELLITDVGFDDNGTSPEDAVPLAVGMEGERIGTINAGDEGDFFLLQVQADTTYQLNLEATDSVNVTSGAEDRFGEVSFGVATASGLIINGSASAGSPGTSEFTAPATEDILLRLTASSSGASGLDLSTAATIQYAISVVEAATDGEDVGFDDNGTSPEDAVPLALGMEGERTGTINAGDEADYFLLQVQADTTYRLNLAEVHCVTLIHFFRVVMRLTS